jgi:hypothetical protein
MKTQCTITQGVGENATATYKNSGLIGHTAIDSSCGYGSAINSYWDKEYVYKVLTKENPANDGSGFTGIFTIVEQNGICFEFLYGHCNPEPNLLGKTITKGTMIGTEANNGEVYTNGMRITLEMQKAGDKRGTHRHDQARLLRKDVLNNPTDKYLSALGGGFLYLNGFFYAIPDYHNGLNGCFDWTKMDEPKPVLEQPEPSLLSFLKAVQIYQVKNGILDFKNDKPEDVLLGKKTLMQYCKDKGIKYADFYKRIK